MASKAAAQSAPSAIPTIEPKRELTGTVSVAAVHQTNISGTNKATALARGISPEDNSVSPNVSVSVTQPIGQNLVFLRGSGGYVFHEQNPGLDSRRIEASGGGIARLSSCRISAIGNYSIGRSDLAQVVGPTVRNLAENKRVSSGVDCQRGIGLGVFAMVSREWLDNSDTIQKQANYNSNSVAGGLNYRNRTLGTVGLVANYSDTHFPRRTFQFAPVIGDDLVLWSVGVSGEKQFGAKLVASGGVQYTHIDRGRVAPGQDGETSATSYQGRLAYKLSNRLQFEATAGRSVSPSDVVGQSYNIETSGELIARYKLGTRIDVSLGARRQKEDSPSDPLGMALVTYNQAKTTSFFGTVRYSVLRNAGISLDVRDEDRKTNLPTFDYTNKRVSLTLDVSY